MVGCVQAVVGKKNFRVKFEDGQRREINMCSLSLVCSKEEVGQGVSETIFDLLKKVNVNC